MPDSQRQEERAVVGLELTELKSALPAWPWRAWPYPRQAE